MIEKKASAWAICERVAEAQARYSMTTQRVADSPADGLLRKLAAIMAEEGLLRAVGYFPPDTPPPVAVAGN
jgi:hypothetical protein